MVKRKLWMNAFIYLGVLLITLFLLFPVYWILMTSFKTMGELFTYPPPLIVGPSLDNYIRLFSGQSSTGGGYLGYLSNSILITALSTLFSLLIGGIGAYGLARAVFKRKDGLAFWILSIRMLPPVAAAIPFYLIMQNLGILDTVWALVIANTTFNLPFVVWMMNGFYADIPREISEAAEVDGCSKLAAFFKIILPLSAPGLAATGIFCMIFSWNEFLFALILTGRSAKTMPVAVASIWTDVAGCWGEVAAASVVTIMPILIVAMLAQKHMVRGLTFGAIK